MRRGRSRGPYVKTAFWSRNGVSIRFRLLPRFSELHIRRLRVAPRDLQSRPVDGEVLLVAAPQVVGRPSVGSAGGGRSGVSVVLVAHNQRVVGPARTGDACRARRDRQAG